MAIVVPSRDAVQHEGCTRLADTPRAVAAALEVEYEVFSAMGFCHASPEKAIPEYRKYVRQSRFFIYEVDGRIVGVLREIDSQPLRPPVFSAFDTYEEHSSLIGDPRVAEVGVLAVEPDYQGLHVAEALYREAWRHAIRRGIRHWGAVLEQWLLDLFTDRYHFAFRPCGPSRYYMGGDCIPVLMAFGDVIQRMSAEDPDLFEWFTSGLPPRLLAQP